jgi:type IV pilus assembly protein PilB
VTYTRERLGDLLVKAGLITEEQIHDALAVQSEYGGKLGEILVHELILTEEQIAGALAAQKGLEHVNLASHEFDRAAISLLPERVARLRTIIPIGFEDDSVVLAMADPLDIEAIDDVELRTGRRVKAVVAGPTQIRYAIDKYLSGADAFQEIAAPADNEQVDIEEADADGVPVVRIVNQFIKEAVRDGASDIHIEPTEKGLRVRMRIDGVLQDVSELPRNARAGVISRVKVMAELDIAERRRPQDGRIQIKVDDRPVDLRVATLPTPHGESIVIRVLNSEISFSELDALGMNALDLATVRHLLQRPYGAILLAGPTGSGKTTTLYAALNEINEPVRKIITVEDPVEYQMEGITQIAINSRIGLTFAAGLRTILRSDPDVVMVGEVRDPETAEIAIRAALTGHLVLTSIHTNDAPSALTRLVDMGVPSYITSSALLGVIAQRLVRKLCDACKQPVPVPKEELMALGYTAADLKDLTVYGAVGCDKCRKTGYTGRIGIFEIMVLDEELTRAFLRNEPSEQIRELALSKGMIPLRRDGLEKIRDGLTSIDELRRVVY